ncbi:MAG: DUF3108 domain-containing protein [bacterium]|jgi:hypothetical protein
MTLGSRCTLLAFVLAALVSAPALPLRAGDLPFAVGEKLTFAIRYEFAKAGEASMEVKEKVECGSGGECFRLVSTAWSTMPFSLFFEVKDVVESYMDAEELYTWRYEKHLKEGNHEASEVVVFDQDANTATYPDGSVMDTPQRVQDVLSSLYFVRTMEIEVGKSIFIDNHADEKNYPLEVKVLKTERVKVPAGTFECYVLEPILKASGIFQHKGRLTVWLSTDPSHVPVMMKSSVAIGAINAVLIDIVRG